MTGLPQALLVMPILVVLGSAALTVAGLGGMPCLDFRVAKAGVIGAARRRESGLHGPDLACVPALFSFICPIRLDELDIPALEESVSIPRRYLEASRRLHSL